MLSLTTSLNISENNALAVSVYIEDMTDATFSSFSCSSLKVVMYQSSELTSNPPMLFTSRSLAY